MQRIFTKGSRAMLDELHVQNLALIRDITFCPDAGLTVVTGETGAGKSALLSACKLVLGDRADADAVAPNAQELRVEGRFFGPDWSEDGCIVQRTVSSDGRSRVQVDGQMSSVKALAQSVGQTVDLCGQHEHQQLMKPANHKAMLDSWAGDEIEPAREAYCEAYRMFTQAQDALASVMEAGQVGQAALDQARFVLERIEQVNPQPDEYEQLAAQVPRLENAEQLARSVNEAHEALSGSDGALDSLGRAAVSLDAVANLDDSLAQAAESIREASYIIEDVSRQTRSYADDIEFGGEELATLQDRMGTLQGLMRSYGPTMQQVIEARNDAQRTIDACDSFEETCARAQQELDAAQAELEQCGTKLHDQRSAAAPRFAQAVTDQMQRLELAGATLECAVTLLDFDRWTAAGPDAVEFMFCPGANMNARPLAKIASGGEISRVMLAVKVVLGNSDSVSTLIFDEVDAGVGGTTALSLAEVLVDLSATHQVIVVTHLPQVAVRGTRHFVVSKTTADGEPQTTLCQVQDDARVAEIARMLSGDTAEHTLAHAQQMLQDAGTL